MNSFGIGCAFQFLGTVHDIKKISDLYPFLCHGKHVWAEKISWLSVSCCPQKQNCSMFINLKEFPLNFIIITGFFFLFPSLYSICMLPSKNLLHKWPFLKEFRMHWETLLVDSVVNLHSLALALWPSGAFLVLFDDPKLRCCWRI